MEDNREPLTYSQKRQLGHLFPGMPVDHLTRQEAAGIIQLNDPYARWRSEEMSYPQREFLRRYGIWKEGITKGQASYLIKYVITLESTIKDTTERLKQLERLRWSLRDANPISLLEVKTTNDGSKTTV